MLGLSCGRRTTTNIRRACIVIVLASPVPISAAQAHESRVTFSAGQPGDPKKPARTVTIAMREEYGRQIYEPDKVEVRRGEQVRFVIRNEGEHVHEFMLATTAENLRHAIAMRKNPDMVHADPNGITVDAGKTGELIWKFTKRGTFEFSCLIPGHREDGMLGVVTVK
jgi:uncharacterized cupredoxin-like copper-binding protein